MQTITEHREKKDHKIMNTEIKQIGISILLQSVIKWAAIVGIAWMVLTFADVWIRLALAG